MASQAAADVSAAIALGIAGVFTLPAFAVSFYHLRLNWHKEWLVKRHRIAVVSSLIALVYIMLIDFPLVALNGNFGVVVYSALGWEISRIPVMLFAVVLYASSALRVWLLYFDQKYGQTLATSKWKILLDPQLHNDWFLQNRQRFGSEKWLLLHVAIPVLLVYALAFNAVYWGFDAAARLFIMMMFGSLFEFFWVLFVAVCFYKYPKLEDVFRVRKELKLSLWLSVLYLMLAIGISVLERFIFGRTLYGFVIVDELITVLWCYLVVFYPQKALTIGSEQQLVETNNFVRWTQLVQSKEGYEAFANFLQREFSVENILFVTEYLQLKQQLCNHEASRQIVENLELEFDVALPESFPLSSIAAAFDAERMEESFYECVTRLYRKYIDSRATFEVNISWRVRSALISVFNADADGLQTTINDVLPLLENAAKEISYLTNDSYSRFMREKVFAELNQSMSNSKTTS